MYTTLNKIRIHQPCPDGWEKLLINLGKNKADDEPLSIIKILDSNGLDHAIWCLRAVDGNYREIRLFAVWCVRQVQHLLTDPRSINAIDTSERFANGLATAYELDAALFAAMDASDDAMGAAFRAASWAAARCASWAAAKTATWAVAMDAVRAAYMGAAMDAAEDAQEKKLREICKKIMEQENG